MTITATDAPPHKRLTRAVSGNAYVLLTLTTLMWAGNAIASRLAGGVVSPMVLTTMRWVIVCLIVLTIARKAIQAEWRLLLPRWRYIFAMGAIGYTIFNSLFYAAGAYTSATNLALFQGSIPVMVIVGSFFAHGARVTLVQMLGVIVTLGGVALASTHGDLSVLRTFTFNFGDILMLAACIVYAIYTVALPARPKVSAMVFFSAMAGAALITSLPGLVWEITSGRAIWPTSPAGLALIAYVGLFPSLLSQLFFMRGVELIGPNRAGLFINLVPIFGPLLGIVLLGERFGPTEAGAVALVLGGIFIAERVGRKTRV